MWTNRIRITFILVFVIGTACSQDHTDVEGNFTFIYHERHSLLLTIQNGTCYFTTIPDEHKGQMQLNYSRTVIETNVAELIRSRNQSRLFSSTLDAMRDEYADLLSDFHCIGKSIYALKLFIPGQTTSITSLLVRLVNGTSPTSGRLEILHNGHWGTVCNDGLTLQDARVVCRMLGITEGSPSVISFGGVLVGTGPILMHNVRCNGHEVSIWDCPHDDGSGFSLCYTHVFDAGISCGQTQSTSTIQSFATTSVSAAHTTPSAAPSTSAHATSMTTPAVRLVNGSSPTSGRLEILHNDQWGTVCNDGMTLQDARVVCNMLGIKGGSPRVINKGGVTIGTGPILMHNVRCNGHEVSIWDCPHQAGAGGIPCNTHVVDAAVSCGRPCQRHGTEHADGDTFSSDCEECTCIDGYFQCKHTDCPYSGFFLVPALLCSC